MHRFGYFEHASGQGVEGQGKTLEEALENTALGVFALMAHPATVLPDRRVEVAFDAGDDAQALLAWLDRLIALAQLRRMVFCAFQLQRTAGHWRGEAWGMAWKPGIDQGDEVQGVLPTPLAVAQEAGRWRARCVVRLAAPA